MSELESPGGAVAAAIRRLLDHHRVPYEELSHPPVSTAEEAARVRGTALSMGAKSIVFKVDGVFSVFALSAAREVSAQALRQNLGAKRTRFASREELKELTGLVPGAVPPFGEPILPLPLFADPSLTAPPRIAFTPGVCDRSILLASADWLALARPRIVSFSRGSEGVRE